MRLIKNIYKIVQKVFMTTDVLKKLYKKLSKDIEFIVTRFKIYYIFKKRNTVYLFRKNIKIKKSSSKLNYTKLNLYLIRKILKRITYKW